MKNLRVAVQILILTITLSGFGYSQQIFIVNKFDEEELKVKFEKFVSELNSVKISEKYPEIARKILSSDSKQQLIAVKMLAASEDVEAIPWAILLLNSDDTYVRTYAGNAIEDIVSDLTLRRRDPKFPQYVLIQPLQKGDVDLRPLAWIALRLMRSGEPSLSAYGITIARYLNLYEFEDEFLKLSRSPHPAVTDNVKWAIESLELQKKYEAGELKIVNP